MERHSVEAIVSALNSAKVRYLIVGGLAVVAHGYVRLTADIDLVLDLESGNVRRALTALKQLGYRPRAPVPLEEFADPQKRAAWVRDQGLTVFSLDSAEHVATEVDLFVEAPLDFDIAYGAAAAMEVAPGIPATFVGLRDLLRLKRQAGRTQDRLDIEQLEALGDATCEGESLIDAKADRIWERGWDGHQTAQRRRLARLPLAEKLQWLEETARLVQQVTASPPSDTTSAADAVRVRRWRAMTTADKAALVVDLSATVTALALAGVRQRYPSASPRECFLRLAILRLGRPLAVRAYPEIDQWPDAR